MRFSRSLWIFGVAGALALVLAGQIFIAPQLQRNAMRKVFDGVITGKLKPNSKGIVVLPKSLSGTSLDAHAYVTREKHLTMVFFPSFFGKGGNVQGTLICSKPLGSKQQSVEIIYPQLLRASYSPGKAQVFIGASLANNTYFVFYDLD